MYMEKLIITLVLAATATAALCARTRQSLTGRCHDIWERGHAVLAQYPSTRGIDSLARDVEPVALDDPQVRAFMDSHGGKEFVDLMCMLTALRSGATLDEARDGISVTPRFPLKAPSQYDYGKLALVFDSANEPLKQTYLEKMPFLFQTWGCTPGLLGVRAAIEGDCGDCEAKSRVLQCYETYANTCPGRPAPASRLLDAQGAVHTLAGASGKVTVVDMWASWCHSCLKKFPAFLHLARSLEQEFPGKVQCVAVSIDDNRQAWLAAAARNGIDALPSYMGDRGSEGSFDADWHVAGVPRYMVIDPEGNITDAFAPAPGAGLREVVMKALRQ